MTQFTYTLDLDALNDIGAEFAATRVNNPSVGAKPRVILPKSDWAIAGRPSVVTVVMGEIDKKEDPRQPDRENTFDPDGHP